VAAEGLLGRLEQTAVQKGFGFTKNRRCPRSMACHGKLDVVSENGEEDVWGGELDGVSDTAGSGSPFIGWRGERGWCPVAASSRLGLARE
jgi:hypothetical protein